MIHQADEVSSILNNFKCDQQTATQIGKELEAKYMDDGIAMKNLLMAIELSQQKDEQAQIGAENLQDSLAAIMN